MRSSLFVFVIGALLSVGCDEETGSPAMCDPPAELWPQTACGILEDAALTSLRERVRQPNGEPCYQSSTIPCPWNRPNSPERISANALVDCIDAVQLQSSATCDDIATALDACAELAR